MKVVCAWCNKEIGEMPHQEGTPDFEVTHGICQSCKEYYLSNWHITLDQFLNRLEAPVLMVNAQGEIVSANDQALKILGKTLDQVSGFKGGEVMECAYARLPGGCGNTIHCPACTIRNSVMGTFETGKSLKSVPAYLNRQNGNTIQKVELLISTEKVDDVVLLRIDEIQ